MKIDPETILICSAIKEESDQISSSTKIQTFLCGIGNLDAGLTLQRFLLEKQSRGDTLPKSILFVGSAGVYPWIHPRFWKNKFGFSTQIQNQDMAKIEKRIRIPEILTDSYEFPNPFQSLSEEEILISKTNATGSITIETVSGRVLDFLRENDIGFENMECFGLAKVCNEFKIPFYAIFALTNTVGPDGSEEWKSNYKKESIKLQEFLISFLL
ncbi:phosphorylase [Leptospira sp. WS92.C1]